MERCSHSGPLALYLAIGLGFRAKGPPPRPDEELRGRVADSGVASAASSADPVRVTRTESRTLLDRDALRGISRRWSSSQGRLLIERVLEHLPDQDLEFLLEGLVHLEDVRCHRADPRCIEDRIADHVFSTRRAEFLGDLVIRNAHGQREPWQTRAWVASTSHLFDLALQRARDRDDERRLGPLLALVEEVDERSDDLVVFEDSCARDELWHSVRTARTRLGNP